MKRINILWISRKCLCFSMILLIVLSVQPAVLAASVQLDVPVVNGKQITITGKLLNNNGEVLRNRRVTLEIINPQQQIEDAIPDADGNNAGSLQNIAGYVKQMMSVDGTYSFLVPMHINAKSGVYTVRVAAEGIGGAAAETFSYVGTDAKIDAISALNQATQSTIGTVISQKYPVLMGSSSTAVNGVMYQRYNGLTNKTLVFEAVMNKGFSLSVENVDNTVNQIVGNFNGAVVTELFNEAANEQALTAAVEDAYNLSLLPPVKVKIENVQGSYLQLGDTKTAFYQALYLRRAFNNPEGFMSAFHQELAIRSIINASLTEKWSKVQEAVFANLDGLTLGTGSGSKYSLLKDVSNVFKAFVGKNFTTVAEIQSIFDNAVNQQYQWESTAQQEGGSYKGGGGGGSGGSSGTTVSINPMPVLPPVQTGRFSDLDAVSWARESIEKLAAQGVIDGEAPGIFSPESKVTREQFIKMLIAGFGLLDGNAVASFDDVQQDAWYYAYIASAQKLGITSGYEDGSFGISKEITRQEMAVLAYRAAKCKNLQLAAGSEEPGFSDTGSIARYAVESIAAMQKLGIINGLSDGRFAPLDSATRAESAKIIYGLLNIQQ